MIKFSNENEHNELNNEDMEFKKYCDLYKERFGKQAYIAEPSGTKQKTINAIKICLDKNEDLLDQLLFPKTDKKMIKYYIKNSYKRSIRKDYNVYV